MEWIEIVCLWVLAGVFVRLAAFCYLAFVGGLTLLACALDDMKWYHWAIEILLWPAALTVYAILVFGAVIQGRKE